MSFSRQATSSAWRTAAGQARCAARSPATTSSKRCFSTSPAAQTAPSWRGKASMASALAIGAGFLMMQTRPALELEGRQKWDQRLKPQARKEAPVKEVAEPESAGTESRVEEALDNTAGVEDAGAEVDGQQSAYDPETGEINWDCPCLGGMAHGPCGEEFKAAFSCFVYSEAEPKGIDCVEKFRSMQECFRRHPEHYKEEIEDDEAAERAAQEAAHSEVHEDKPAAEELKA